MQNGKTVNAALVSESGGYVFLKKENGAMVNIASISLSQEDRDYIMKLKTPGEMGGMPTAPDATPGASDSTLSNADPEFARGRTQHGAQDPLSSDQHNSQTPAPSVSMAGIQGLEKARRIQQTSGLPIILWSTWAACPHCAKVNQWFDESTEMRALKQYPRVMLQSKGEAEEVKESGQKGFKGGTFYVIFDYERGDMESVWAWEKGSRTLKPDLAQQILEKIADRLRKTPSSGTQDK